MDINRSCRYSLPDILKHLVFLVLSWTCWNCEMVTGVSDGTTLELVENLDQKEYRPLSNLLTRGRVKRSVGFTLSQQHAIVELHNRFRGEANPPAANMEHMTWSDNLAKAAQAWSENCTWGHGPAGAVTVQYGQNVWLDKIATTGSPVGITATRAWFEESRFYDYQTNQCSGEQCGHYTQLMWASSKQVGCGRHLCPRVTGAGDVRAWFITCNYYPPGNFPGMKPYISGESCTKCASGTGICSNNLCRNCTGISTQCECRQVCHNGGTLNRNNCTCACPNGYFGTDCSEYCEDKHPLCGKSPGWPGYWTCLLHPNIPRNCPKMCKVCNEKMESTSISPLNVAPDPHTQSGLTVSTSGLMTQSPIDASANLYDHQQDETAPTSGLITPSPIHAIANLHDHQQDGPASTSGSMMQSPLHSPPNLHDHQQDGPTSTSGSMMQSPVHSPPNLRDHQQDGPASTSGSMMQSPLHTPPNLHDHQVNTSVHQYPEINNGDLNKECRQVCHNGGSLNRNNCTCACPNGYFGPDCTECCEDKHPLCWKFLGWPYWTCTLHPVLQRYCPKMCKVCNTSRCNT